MWFLVDFEKKNFSSKPKKFYRTLKIFKFLNMKPNLAGHSDESKLLSWCLLRFSGHCVHVEQLYTEKSVKIGLADFLWRSEDSQKPVFLKNFYPFVSCVCKFH